MRRTLLALICLACLYAVACSRAPENKSPDATTASTAPSPSAATDTDPPADVVQASAQATELAAGGKSEVLVSVKIANGYHINGNPASKFQIATALKVEAGDGLTASEPVYPVPVSKKFSFSPEPITVYEGEALIKLPLRADAGVSKGARTLIGKLKVQPCDDSVCYPPRTLDVALPVLVK